MQKQPNIGCGWAIRFISNHYLAFSFTKSILMNMESVEIVFISYSFAYENDIGLQKFSLQFKDIMCTINTVQ